MKKAIASLALSALMTAAASAQSVESVRAMNALRDSNRAQERQADSLRRIDQRDYDRALHEDRDRRNAARDGRSARRFDTR